MPDLLPSIVCGTSLALENGDKQLNTAKIISFAVRLQFAVTSSWD